MRLLRFVIAWLLLVTGEAVADDGPIALTHVRLIDGSGGPAIDDTTIVIAGGRVLAAGPAATVPPGAAVRELRGKTVTPGLISDHSHIGQVRGVSVGAQNYTRETIEGELRQYRNYGVTTITALGNNGPLFETIRAEAHAGKTDGADLFGVDRAIGVPDGAPPQAMIKVGADQLFRPRNADEARAAVDAMADRKTDLVKIWLDDFGGGVPAKMSPAVYQAVIDQSHKRGVRVAAHIHDLADARAIVAAGADIIAHGVRDQPVDAEFIAALKAKGVWYIPTLALDDASFAWADQAAWTQTAFAKAAISPELAHQIDDSEWRAKILGDPKLKGSRTSLVMNQKNLKTLFDAGVKIGFGTDSGATPLRVAGIAEHRELALMVEAGLTPMQALTIATTHAAELLGLHDRGRIAAGLRADLIVFDADPLQEIGNSKTIRETWVLGRAYPRAAEAKP
ncbi:amidohydrolase family protein [Paludisphaera rhizosphaerae]|uniref:amidohydrolase family protein n=1 Tax=Paludisphaera rhizosphaerae TaxID=2711216 RepID=UPI0013EA47FC|nr:amidohydrolase family protein [Paludisphaera rhizosphaerae]